MINFQSYEMIPLIIDAVLTIRLPAPRSKTSSRCNHRQIVSRPILPFRESKRHPLITHGMHVPSDRYISLKSQNLLYLQYFLFLSPPATASLTNFVHFLLQFRRSESRTQGWRNLTNLLHLCLRQDNLSADGRCRTGSTRQLQCLGVCNIDKIHRNTPAA